MATRTAFFYGTLMSPAVLERVTARPSTDHTSTTFTIRPAVLQDHRRHRVRGADYPAILPATHSSVRGTHVTGLTDADVRRLDIFEGHMYERRKVTVRVLAYGGGGDALPWRGSEDALPWQAGEEVETETYVWTAGEAYLEDREWDFDEFVRDKLWRWADVRQNPDEGFKDVEDAEDAESEEEEEDPTGGRGVRNKELARKLEDGEAKEVLRSAV